MYLHLGQDTVILQDEIIGLFDLDNTTSSHITRDFLRRAEKQGVLQTVGEDIPRSFVLVQTEDTQAVYLSQLSTTTLKERTNEQPA